MSNETIKKLVKASNAFTSQKKKYSRQGVRAIKSIYMKG